MRQKLKKLMLSAVSRTVGPTLGNKLADRLSGVGTILMMHRVVARKSDSAASKLTITAAYLESAILRLREEGVEFVDLAELSRRLASGAPSSGRMIALTFDDGYRDNLTLALPVLQKHQVPATIFVPSGAPDRDMDVWFLRLERAVMTHTALRIDHPALPMELPADTPDRKIETYRRLARFIHANIPERRAHVERLLPQHAISDEGLMGDYFASWDELRDAAADPLLTIGGHTVSHPVLSALTEPQAFSEMSRGRDRLAMKLDRNIRFFSYPYGGRTECGAREYRLAKQVGFDLAVTTRYDNLRAGHQKCRHALPRMTLGGLQENVATLSLDVFGRVGSEPSDAQPFVSA